MIKNLLMLFICIICSSLTAADNLLDYQVEDNTYAVVYIESDATSRCEAREQALKRAAELAQSNGYRYIVINAEQKVQVAKFNSPSHPFHDNMYQELIIEKDRGRNSISQRSLPPNNPIYPGLKITYSCFRDLPVDQANVIDVCSLIYCD